ncbi:response regulator [Phormidium sp. LEGE 05292]|uniref:response regulator n=1 Tax=[Phormidium] sp. LEGE 05292 TaxID=767427 RepID=UPI001881E9A2|nr:response regulator [Phormidium sp. LEGE 05292]MBE9227408.1 response regulator [Phormidium sp. LEGE 05292]
MTQPSYTILIVEDSPEDQELYRRYLLRDRQSSYTILEASLGEEGLELWQEHRPDVVLLDYRLPDLDGLEFLSRLQSWVQQPCLPVIIVTGVGNETIALQAIEAGAQDYLVKGKMTPEELRLSIGRTIATVNLHVKLQQQLERERLTRRISQQIHQSLEIEQILQTTVTEVRQFLQTDRVIVFQLQSDGNGVVVAESVDSAWQAVLSTNIYDPCFTENYIEPYRQGRILAKSDIYDGSLSPCHVEFLAQFQVQANLVVPILRDNELWGLLIAHHCAAVRSWQTMEIELLQQLAVHLGIALQQASTYTQLKKQSEARYRAIVEDQTELIARYLPDTTIVFANTAYCRYFGLKLEEIIGKSYNPAIFEEDREMVTQLVNSMSAENPTVTIENRVIVNGEIRWTQWVNRMLFDEQGQFTEFQSVGRDITLVKEADAQLRRSSERISLANAELARAARLKDEFLANMSHELRTPLNSILGLTETLLEELFGSLTDQQRQFIQTIEQSGEHLLGLINDILDLAKIESGKMELQLRSVELHSVCASSLKFVRQQARHKKIQLSCEIDPNISEIEADERRLLQVLVNLLSNAVKFTPDRGRVELEVRMKSEQQAVEFQVKDSGIGISPENLNQIFQPFIQLESSLSRRYDGTGLGLSIVKRIVELHGGSIRVDSQVGRGSCFTVTLPWHPLSKQDDSPLPETLLREVEIQQVLVVEDSGTAAGQIKRYLAEIGATSVIHPVGTGALDVALRVKPDVIVLDILLPDCSGWEVLSELKAHPQTKSIPVIVVSVMDDRSRSLEMGATEHLLKPLSRPKFYQALNRLFANVHRPNPETALIVAATESAEAPKILLTEDNEANITTMLSYLQAHGFQVMIARTGLEAIQMAKQHQPDIILMDIQMPEMDGIEATRQIRADSETSSIPIVALTALAMPGDSERCLSAGANDYFAKPVKLKQLVERINQLLPKRRNQ